MVTSELGIKNKAGTSDGLSVATEFCEVPGDSPPAAPAPTFTTTRLCTWACPALLPAPTSKKDNHRGGDFSSGDSIWGTDFAHCLFSVSLRHLR